MRGRLCQTTGPVSCMERKMTSGVDDYSQDETSNEYFVGWIEHIDILEIYDWANEMSKREAIS
jgi:hypothetical protein